MIGDERAVEEPAPVAVTLLPLRPRSGAEVEEPLVAVEGRVVGDPVRRVGEDLARCGWNDALISQANGATNRTATGDQDAGS